MHRKPPIDLFIRISFFHLKKILDFMHNFCLLKFWNEYNTFKMASSKENRVYETILTSEHSAAE